MFPRILAIALVMALSLLADSVPAEDSPAVGAKAETKSDESSEKTNSLSSAEQEFAKLLTGADLVGSFSTDGNTGAPKQDRYTIAKAEKVKGDKWRIHSRVKYGTVDVVVPIQVNVQWAGETPVLSLKKLSIPLLGDDFGACLVFDGDRYAGTWNHGKVGGHMWGRIERAKSEDLPKVESNSKE